MSGVDILGFSLENPSFPRAAQPLPNHHYTTSVASSAPSSASSVFSLDSVSSASSVGSTWENGASRESSGIAVGEPGLISRVKEGCGYKVAGKAVAPELRQNPRRTQRGSARARPPPSLVSQNDRKVSFVDRLVGKLSSSSSSFLRQRYIHRFTDLTVSVLVFSLCLFVQIQLHRLLRLYGLSLSLLLGAIAH